MLAGQLGEHWLLKERGVELVGRLNKAHRTSDFRRGQRLGVDDHIVLWFKPTSIRSLDRPSYQLPTGVHHDSQRRGSG